MKIVKRMAKRNKSVRLGSVCSVCRHPQRSDIDRLLVSPDGPTLAELSVTYGPSPAALSRHRSTHIRESLIRACEIKALAPPVKGVLAQVRDVATRFERQWNAAESIITRAMAERDPNLALKAMSRAVVIGRELRKTLELIGKSTGELHSPEADRGGGIIVLPVAVPAGEITPLDSEIPKQAIERAVSDLQSSADLPLEAEFEDLETSGHEDLEASNSEIAGGHEDLNSEIGQAGASPGDSSPGDGGA